MKPGDIIVFTHTGVRAYITRLDVGSAGFWVRCFGDVEEIYAFNDDVVPEAYFSGSLPEPTKTKKQKKQELNRSTADLFGYSEEDEHAVPPPPQPVFSTPKTAVDRNYTTNKIENKGLYWGLVTLDDTEFELLLLNDSPYNLNLQTQYKTNNYETAFDFNLTVLEYSITPMAILSRASILEGNESLLVNCKLFGQHELKLIGKLLIKRQGLPLIGIEGIAKEICNKTTLENKSKSKIDLREITPDFIEPNDKHTKQRAFSVNMVDFATFPRKLDLHYEKIKPHDYTHEPDEILSFQIEYFKSMLEKAYQLNIPQFDVIHGIGNSILKSIVVTELSKPPYSKHFTHVNEYIENCGFGATRIKKKEGFK